MRTYKRNETTPRAHILTEANRLTHGPRDGLYGTPALNHQRIAALWSAYLETEITPEQAATCMALLKIARSIASSEADHFIDGAAYLAIAYECTQIEGKIE